MKTYYGVDINEQKQKLLASKKALPLIQEIIINADKAMDEEYHIDKITEYMAYFETGVRNDGEIFKRRTNCSNLAIALWLTEDKKYIKPLLDHIFYICNEFTWCVPAHSGMIGGKEVKVERLIRNIELNMAETAMLLTDVAVLTGEQLPYYAVERIEYELRRRIFDAYKTYDCFEAAECQNNNWATVCACGCGIALLHFGTKEEIEQLLPRLIGGMDRYLKGVNEDGCCLEGPHYWGYGFGHYLLFARALYDYSNGEINYLHNEKVRKLSLYLQRVRISDTKVVSFSDGESKFAFSPGLLSFLKTLNKNVCLPELKYARCFGGDCSVKDFLWFDTEYEADEQEYTTTFFEKSEWYIRKCEKYSFAAKGGHNYEPHNHNDIGSFMITVNEDMPIVDFGRPQYIIYLDNDDRFKESGFLNFSSRGHSLPIIDGKYQCLGAEYKAKNVHGDDTEFSLDIEGAYEEGLVNKIHRSFSFKENSVILKDTFVYSEKTRNIVERFTSWTKPQVYEGEVELGKLYIAFDKEKYTVNIQEDSYPAHSEPHAPVGVYFIDFIPCNPVQTEFEFEFVV